MAAIARIQDNTVHTVLGLTYGEAVEQTLDLFLNGLTTHDSADHQRQTRLAGEEHTRSRSGTSDRIV